MFLRVMFAVAGCCLIVVRLQIAPSNSCKIANFLPDRVRRAFFSGCIL